MTFLGMIIATVILLISFHMIGPYGIAFLLILLFGLIFSTYQKQKQIKEDLTAIREKLGLLSEDEKVKLDEKKHMEEYNRIKDDPEKIAEVNKAIESKLQNDINEKQ